MKTIVCFGDSNTWGYDPLTGERLSIHDRWAGVLRDELGEGFYVVEEGLNGRTTIWEDPTAEYRNGSEYLLPCLWSHAPVDLVTIMLGTNDLKSMFGQSADGIANGAGTLVGMALRSGAGAAGIAPRVLLIAPPPLGKITELYEDWGLGRGKKESERFAQLYRTVAEQYGCDYLDTSYIIKSSELDGIHFEREEHYKLGRAVAERVRNILGQP